MSAGERAVEAVRGVDPEVAAYFREAAGKLLADGASAEAVLAAALAQLAGHTKMQAFFWTKY